MQYIEFARAEKAYKKLNEIFTAVVRLHPTTAALWIYAARYFMDTQADITNARSYMQRGLRFCKNSEDLWLEYAKLETIYIAKIAGRRKILGLDIDRSKQAITDEGFDADMITLPDVTAEDVNPSLAKEDGVDEDALQNLASAPVLTGAIPIAIFDSAMKQFSGESALAEQFFAMFAEFDQLPCIKRILQHVLSHLQETSPQSVHAIICSFRMQLFGIRPTSPDFPSALRDSLQLLSSGIQPHSDTKAQLSVAAIRQILPLLRATEDADEPALRKVLASSLRKYARSLEEAGEGNGDAVVQMAKSLQQESKKEDARRLVHLSLKQWGSNEDLQQLQTALNT
jgi:U3 small nucleolar RNA-associated protein 6